VGRPPEQKDQVQLRLAHYLVGQVASVRTAGELSRRPETHRQSLRRLLTYYRSDPIPCFLTWLGHGARPATDQTKQAFCNTLKRVTRRSAGDEPSGKQPPSRQTDPTAGWQAHKDGQGGRDKPGGHGKDQPGKNKDKQHPPTTPGSAAVLAGRTRAAEHLALGGVLELVGPARCSWARRHPDEITIYRPR
jgi:hypothetical protein